MTMFLMKDTNRQLSMTGFSWLTLFTSTGTLFCCALPFLLVSLGFGATVAALMSEIPALIILGQYKVWIFVISSSLLTWTALQIWRNKEQCPADPAAALLCQQAQRWNRRIWIISLCIWCMGFFASFIALPFRLWLEL